MTRRERLERKLEKRREWAESRRADAANRFDAAHKATEHIPFGQPILVGHHSERHHRAAIAKSDTNMRKGCESADMAEHHDSKAEGLESQLDGSIFSDDPDALEQIAARIAELEAEQTEAKRLNAWWRKHKSMKGCPGLSDASAERFDREIPTHYSFDQQPVASYSLKNRNANIRRLKQRAEEIKRRQARAEAAEKNGGIVIEGTDWIRVTFAEKPSREILDALKAAGFRWGSGSWIGQRIHLPACVAEETASA